MHFEIYQHWLTRQWRWRLQSANGRIIAYSGESYINKLDCLDAIALIKRDAGLALIEWPWAKGSR